MKEKQRTDDPFRTGLRPPAPPADLKEPVMQAAREAMARPLPDLWGRLWINPVIRTAWAAAVVILLLAHLAIQLKERHTPQRRSVQALYRGLLALEVAEIVHLPKIDTSLLPTFNTFNPTPSGHPSPAGNHNENEAKETNS